MLAFVGILIILLARTLQVKVKQGLKFPHYNCTTTNAAAVAQNCMCSRKTRLWYGTYFAYSVLVNLSLHRGFDFHNHLVKTRTKHGAINTLFLKAAFKVKEYDPEIILTEY